MTNPTDDLRITNIVELSSPARIIDELPRDETVSKTVLGARSAMHDILTKKDDRLLVVVGPCSIHDPVAAIDYAKRLKEQRDRLQGDLEIVMRVYFEKPRTTVGWKGLINDPGLDGSFRIEDGLRIARKLLLDVNDLELPAGCEFLDTITPQYIADLVSWGAIGAARPKARFIENSPPACPRRSASRTAPPAMSVSPSTPSWLLRSRIIFRR